MMSPNSSEDNNELTHSLKITDLNFEKVNIIEMLGGLIKREKG